MKICMMTNTYLPHVGGVARSVQTFTEDFRRLGHEVLVVAPTFPKKHGEKTTKEKDVVRLPAIQQFNGSDFSVRFPMSALFDKKLTEFKPNIIHSHHPFLLGDTALRISAEKHAAVIFTHHTMYEQYTHYVPFNSDALKQFVVELSTQYANLCDGVIAPSQSIASLIRKRGVVSPIKVIPTGIDIAAFAGGNGDIFRAANQISPDAFVVGHVGRLAPEKNLVYLARSICLFLKREPKAVFLVVGGGPAENQIRRVFQKERLEQRLVLPGKKTGQDLCNAYKAMDLFVFSSFSETQGMVVAEAMAAGLPVVALDASGVREVVRDGKNGYLLDANAGENAFAQCCEGIASAPELRKNLQTGARRTARSFSRERSAEKALAFYDLIRERTRRKRRQRAVDPWSSLIGQIKMEWDIITEKAGSAIKAIISDSSGTPNQ